MRAICCTCSTVLGATAAAARRSVGSLRSGEYASRYSATSSSDLNTHCAPMAVSNLRSAAANSVALTPFANVGMALSVSPRRDDPGVQRPVDGDAVTLLHRQRRVVVNERRLFRAGNPGQQLRRADGRADVCGQRYPALASELLEHEQRAPLRESGERGLPFAPELIELAIDSGDVAVVEGV